MSTKVVAQIQGIPLDSQLWQGSFNAKESSLHQLAPYVGKLKSGMVRVLLDQYSNPGDTVLDPFCGSGVVALESVLCGRNAVANDLSPYAYILTLGKLSAPHTKEEALKQAMGLVDAVEAQASFCDTTYIPDWVKQFFHPHTLQEVAVAFQILHEQQSYFLMACLLGILHHVRPGFLSYPASHLTPYLRFQKYPPEEFPEMYQYRDLRSRLLAKVERAYRRDFTSEGRQNNRYRLLKENAKCLPIENEEVDTVISSPPYFGALDYARDNRLRLWFLGVEDWKELDASLTANDKVYVQDMRLCLKEMHRVLRSGGYCVLILGDVTRDGKTRKTSEMMADLALDETKGGLKPLAIYDDTIPDERRARRRTRTTLHERILVMRKA